MNLNQDLTRCGARGVAFFDDDFIPSSVWL